MEKSAKETDLYGFPLENGRKSLPEQNPKKRSQSLKQSNARIEKWRVFLHLHSEVLEKRPVPFLYKKKLRSRIRKGIPSSLRGLVWSKLARISDLTFKISDFEQDNKEVLHEISLDVTRTFPDNLFFLEQVGKSAITKILSAISKSRPAMGYCQGLNFIAAALSMFLDDEKSFLILSSILSKYRMELIYTDLTKLRGIFRTFEELLKRFLPKVFAKLSSLGINPEIYATSWFLTFYVDRMPFETFLRIFDIFLLEERKILYRVGLAIFKLKQTKILAKKAGFEEVMLELKDFEGKEWDDPDLLIKTAVSFKFSGKWLRGVEERHKVSH